MAFLDILDDPMDNGSAVLFAPLSDADMARLPVWLVPESTFSHGARAADVPFHLDGQGALCVHGGTSQYATVTVPRGALLCHRNGTAMRQRAGVFDRGTVPSHRPRARSW